MKVDEDGRVYVAVAQGVWVYEPTGTFWASSPPRNARPIWPGAAPTARPWRSPPWTPCTRCDSRCQASCRGSPGDCPRGLWGRSQGPHSVPRPTSDDDPTLEFRYNQVNPVERLIESTLRNRASYAECLLLPTRLCGGIYGAGNAMSGEPYRVFVSHGSHDLWLAAQIRKVVREVGAEAFLDETDAPKGTDFKKRIHQELGRSDELIALFTP